MSVDPSMSVKRKVTVPVGRAAARAARHHRATFAEAIPPLLGRRWIIGVNEIRTVGLEAGAGVKVTRLIERFVCGWRRGRPLALLGQPKLEASPLAIQTDLALTGEPPDCHEHDRLGGFDASLHGRQAGFAIPAQELPDVAGCIPNRIHRPHD